jgi:hypothetical protein
MRDVQDGNAMTEIALALAMAFFSIMVLAMISMGTGMAEDASAGIRLPEGVTLRPAETAVSASSETIPADTLLIHYAGRFLDAHLQPAAPERFGNGRTVVLAINPTLSMTEALAVRAKVPGARVTVTTLNNDWLQALKEMQR